MIHHGDCIDVMAGMDPESVDAVVCDPPYGLEFMGKEWDRLDAEFVGGGPSGSERFKNWRGPRFYNQKGIDQQAFHTRWAEAAYRVAKPSAYLLAFGGTRTVHRMTVALEDAGWIIRDMLVWGYASGFPKSKASLKPAWEPIVMARKPGPLRMLAIDECRLPVSADDPVNGAVWTDRRGGDATIMTNPEGTRRDVTPSLGRWPANIVLTDPIFDGGVVGVVAGETHARGNVTPTKREHSDGAWAANGAAFGIGPDGPIDPGDSGTYSRFFLVPKAARADREPVLGGLPLQAWGVHDDDAYREPGERKSNHTAPGPRQNVHPTVKPVDLMRHLVRLVTPTGGVVLDPFGGSGTTALACEMEGFEWILIEREADYVAIAEARLNGTQRGLGLAV